MASSSVSRIFRPNSFFGFISLLTATEFITVALLINKVEGVYGILALFTGFHLSALQFSMYLWSVLVFTLVCYLGAHIRKQSPLQNLVLAWIYVLDTVINAAYTALFGLTWFITLAQHLSPAESGKGGAASPPGGKTINDTAGFTDPEHKVDKVEVITNPSPSKIPGQEGVALGVSGDGSNISRAIFDSGSIMSLSIIGALWFIRVYCVIIVMSYARRVLRRTMARQAFAPEQEAHAHDPNSAATLVAPTASFGERNPFAQTSPHGKGWQGSLGRFLVRFPSTYWIGHDEADEEWIRAADDRFKSRGVGSKQHRPTSTLLRNPPPQPGSQGTKERERRARSGTGPPPPGLDVVSPSTSGQPSEEAAVKRSNEY